MTAKLTRSTLGRPGRGASQGGDLLEYTEATYIATAW